MRYDSHSEGDYGDAVCVFRIKPGGPFYSQFHGRVEVIRIDGKRRIKSPRDAKQWARAKFLELRDYKDRGQTRRMFEEDAAPRSYVPLKSQPEDLYFVQCETTCRIKIGIAVDAQKRLRHLQTGSPTRLRVVAVIPGGAMGEVLHHRRFDDDHLHGEWFELSEELLAYINEVRGQTKEECADVLVPPNGPKKTDWDA